MAVGALVAVAVAVAVDSAVGEEVGEAVAWFVFVGVCVRGSAAREHAASKTIARIPVAWRGRTGF